MTQLTLSKQYVIFLKIGGGSSSFYSLLKTFLFARAWAGSASE